MDNAQNGYSSADNTGKIKKKNLSENLAPVHNFPIKKTSNQFD